MLLCLLIVHDVTFCTVLFSRHYCITNVGVNLRSNSIMRVAGRVTNQSTLYNSLKIKMFIKYEDSLDILDTEILRGEIKQKEHRIDKEQ